ncbi:MAG: glycerate kinase, partial [Burkholderiales bacterium PBB4]
MPFKNILIPILALLATLLAFLQASWSGVALVVGGLVMWMLLQMTRTLQVLKRAADRPVGYVASAIMLHSKLRPGLPWQQVVALPRAL